MNLNLFTGPLHAKKTQAHWMNEGRNVTIIPGRGNRAQASTAYTMALLKKHNLQ